LNRVLFRRRQIPVNFFDRCRNVGDRLNFTVVERISGRKIYRVKTRKFPHLVAIGSMLSGCCKTSYIWGCGSIDGKALGSKLVKKNVFALRGRRSLQLVRMSCGDSSFTVPLGDPAILLPFIIDVSNVRVSAKVGVICHYADVTAFNELISGSGLRSSIKLISVELTVDEFVRAVVSCQFILSSSLHGLIIADSYKIPNRWIRLTDNIKGGDFKYLDYYSTTENPKQSASEIRSIAEFKQLLQSLEHCCDVKPYAFDAGDLIDAFPAKAFGIKAIAPFLSDSN